MADAAERQRCVPYRRRPKNDAPLLSQAVVAAIKSSWELFSRVSVPVKSVWV